MNGSDGWITDGYQIIVRAREGYLDSLMRFFYENEIGINHLCALSYQEQGEYYLDVTLVPRKGAIDTVGQYLDSFPCKYRRLSLFRRMPQRTIPTVRNICKRLSDGNINTLFTEPEAYDQFVVVVDAVPQYRSIVAARLDEIGADADPNANHGVALNSKWELTAIKKPTVALHSIADDAGEFLRLLNGLNSQLIIPATVWVVRSILRNRQWALIAFMEDTPVLNLNAPVRALCLVPVDQKKERLEGVWMTLQSLFRDLGPLESIFENIFTCPYDGLTSDILYERR